MGAPPNTLVVNRGNYLLVWTGGDAVHLVAETGPGEAARSIADARYGSAPNPRFATTELEQAIWRLGTLCGRRDWLMCPTDAGGVYDTARSRRQEPVYAPSCKRCLQTLDRQFRQPEPDDRLPWNVVRCIDELATWGCFMIDNVPSEQVNQLRNKVRQEARRRGWQFASRSSDQRLIGTSENSVTPERRSLVERDSRERMEGIANEAPALPRPSWQFTW